MIHLRQHVFQRGGTGTEKGVAHARIRLAAVVLAAAVGGTRDAQRGGRIKVGDAAPEGAVLHDLCGTRHEAFIIEKVGAVGPGPAWVVVDIHQRGGNRPVNEMSRPGALFQEHVRFHAVPEGFVADHPADSRRGDDLVFARLDPLRAQQRHRGSDHFADLLVAEFQRFPSRAGAFALPVVTHLPVFPGDKNKKIQDHALDALGCVRAAIGEDGMFV